MSSPALFDATALWAVSPMLALTAGVVLFPSYWRILEKLGHRQEAIHGPVPHYAEDLAGTLRHGAVHLPFDDESLHRGATDTLGRLHCGKTARKIPIHAPASRIRRHKKLLQHHKR